MSHRKETLYDARETTLKAEIKRFKRRMHRELSAEQKNKILAGLKSVRPSEIMVFNAPDLESQNYADQITEVLKAAGWNVPPAPAHFLTRSASGIIFMVHRSERYGTVGDQVAACTQRCRNNNFRNNS